MVSKPQRTTLRRLKPGAVYRQAKSRRHDGQTFTVRRVKAAVDAGLLRWVNRCRSAAVLTERAERSL